MATSRGLYDPNRLVHYRLEGKHARPLCGCKMAPGIRPKRLSRLGCETLPPPIAPDGEGLWMGTCSRCYELAQRYVRPPQPYMPPHSVPQPARQAPVEPLFPEEEA